MTEPRGIPAGLEPKLTKAISEFFARTYDGESEADVLIDIIADAILADRAELDRLREENERLRSQLERMVDIAEMRLIAIHKALEPAAFGINGIESPEDGVNYMTGVLRAALSPDNSTQKKEG